MRTLLPPSFEEFKVRASAYAINAISWLPALRNGCTPIARFYHFTIFKNEPRSRATNLIRVGVFPLSTWFPTICMTYAPVLEDSATDEEEKTEKVEELVKIQGCRVVHKTFIQSSQPVSPAVKTLRSPRIASSNHKEQMLYSDVESAVSLLGRPSTHFARKFDSSFQRPDRTKLFEHRFFRVLHPD